ncbi:hypothetical protein SSIG_03806 [Streptomyces filamentosus NRRL 11379]|uniref:Predicted protein n=1 Tax=Streptomyces filamentosus NRRL 15998 TaxID=457431 RepID=D6AU36_STRFL|nr:predicted protein [Streptomyces filamentosus NRRL 15998]EWS93231.1 hypothetical protein SSIG_03806 [Streptomyces filamentosus NRRL 11379]
MAFTSYQKAARTLAGVAHAPADAHGVGDQLTAEAGIMISAIFSDPEYVPSVAARAWRWAPEMAEAADALRAADLPPDMAEAAASGARTRAPSLGISGAWTFGRDLTCTFLRGSFYFHGLWRLYLTAVVRTAGHGWGAAGRVSSGLACIVLSASGLRAAISLRAESPALGAVRRCRWPMPAPTGAAR